MDDCSRSTIKNKSDFCYDGQLYPQRFPLMPEDSIFCGLFFLCHNDRNRCTTVLVVRFCFAVLYCPLKNDSKEALNMMKNMVLATNFGKANEMNL